MRTQIQMYRNEQEALDEIDREKERQRIALYNFNRRYAAQRPQARIPRDGLLMGIGVSVIIVGVSVLLWLLMVGAFSL